MRIPFPDEILEPKQCGLVDFVQRGRELMAQGHFQDVADYVLSGRALPQGDNDDPIDIDDEGDDERRVFLNALQGVDNGSLEHCELKGDFDSLIGFSDTIPLLCPLGIYPVPDFKKTLKKPIHIDLEVRRLQVRLGSLGRGMSAC